MKKPNTNYFFRKGIYITLILFVLLLTACGKKSEKSINENKEQEVPVINETQAEIEPSVDTETVKGTEEQQKVQEAKKDVITYGKVENEDTKIPFKTLEKKADNTKEKGTSGIVTKGQNGISRKEVKKVYKNGKYSHKETVKESYVLKVPVNQQEWYGTKEKKQESTKESFTDQVVRLTNEERKKKNLAPLKVHNKLTGIAKTRANDITKLFEHKRPDGSDITTLLKDVKYQKFGENIAMGQRTPAEVVKGWMNSQGHRENILDKDFTHIGIGLVENNEGVKHWVQLFMK